jgi:hypothetical protein
VPSLSRCHVWQSCGTALACWGRVCVFLGVVALSARSCALRQCCTSDAGGHGVKIIMGYALITELLTWGLVQGRAPCWRPSLENCKACQGGYACAALLRMCHSGPGSCPPRCAKTSCSTNQCGPVASCQGHNGDRCRWPRLQSASHHPSRHAVCMLVHDVAHSTHLMRALI